MTYDAVLRGYLLEEALAWLLRNTGYRLLTDQSQDREALGRARGSLVVHGRGADHQVDVLGEFALTPAFSLPIRMFIEAKFYSSSRCELPAVRNAHGVVHDINENFVHPAGSRPRRRYQYAYALFSASGFTRPAQDYGLAQQISLIDLSGASFAWLREGIAETAGQLYMLYDRRQIRRFPVSWMRHLLRTRLRTTPSAYELADPMGMAEGFPTNAPRFRAAATAVLDGFAAALRAREKAELLLGFPAAPFILPLAADDPDLYLAYANSRPVHRVRLRRNGDAAGAEWVVTPRDEPEAYRLTFTLPERVESWISESEGRLTKRTHAIKEDSLSGITIYRMAGEEMRVYQLRYEPSELRGPMP